ncbi:MAG: hypothetical protein QM689_07710 [Oscillospiraceae bacterium]
MDMVSLLSTPNSTATAASSSEDTMTALLDAVSDAQDTSAADAFAKEGYTSSETTADTTGTGIYSKSTLNKTLEEMETQRQNAMSQMISDMLTQQANAKGLDFTGLAGVVNNSTSLKVTINASVEFTAEDSAEAADSISGDGYWSAEKVSDRILDMAKLLANGDASNLDTLTDAINKGFESAYSAFGYSSIDEMPDVTKQTYSLVQSKLDDWKKSLTGASDETDATAETE